MAEQIDLVSEMRLAQKRERVYVTNNTCQTDTLETQKSFFRFIVFTARQRAMCYRPFVRLFVTRVDQSKPVEARIMQFSPYGSPFPLIFGVTFIQKF